MSRNTVPSTPPPAGRALIAAAAVLGTVVLTAACRGGGAGLRQTLRPATPHQRYAQALRTAGLAATALGGDWLAASQRALREAHPVVLPYRESGYFAESEAAAVGYRFAVRRGQRIVAQVEVQAAAPVRIFLDLFEQAADSLGSLLPVASAGDTARRLEAEARRDGVYLLRLQPELLRSGRYTLTVESGPSLAFPVPGKDRRAVGSVFGDSRDAGHRQHQGIDIFAPRGTPALAAADGTVWVGTNELGGKVVFLWDERRHQNLYYAHLDSQLVRSGERVRVGDTIGRVGNTGNARSTPPHLHFGIYRRGEGAVDPFPFVAPSRATPAPLAADTGALGSWARVARRVTEVRAAPADGAPALRTLTRWTPVRVVGASGRWFRVDLPDGAEGYVLAAATEPAAPAGASRPRRPTALLDAPTPAAAVMDSVSAGTTLRVLGRFAEFLYVRAPSGRAGWVMVEGPGTRDRGQE